MGKEGLLYSDGESINGAATMQVSEGHLPKPKLEPLYGPAIPLLAVYPKYSKSAEIPFKVDVEPS